MLMINIKDVKYSEELLISADLIVMCLGYEDRSFFILDKVYREDFFSKLLPFTISDYASFEQDKVNRIEQVRDQIPFCQVVSYEDSDKVNNVIVERAKALQNEKKSISIVIDYSSMPRGWYCKMPETLFEILRKDDVACFLYSEGKYSEGPEAYQTVGVEAYKVFSGKASISVQAPRAHLIGVGYDSMRTQGVISIIDPEYYVVCEAYDPEFESIRQKVEGANSSIIEQTKLVLTLFINEMEFMISKLRGTINELFLSGNSTVVLIPDGPKPLVFAMSLMPWLMNREGVVCIHIVRNNAGLFRKNVEANGKIIAFSVSRDI